MDALKQVEDHAVVGLGHADAVVGDGEDPLPGFLPGADADPRDACRMAELQGVGYQVLEELGQLHQVGDDHRQR